MGMKLFSIEKSSHNYEQKKISDYDPNPSNFRIKNIYENNGHCVVYINYPNCINYEGNKILVFKDTKKEKIRKLNEIDPHFSDSENKVKLIARFEPTDEGWQLAKEFLNFI